MTYISIHKKILILFFTFYSLAAWSSPSYKEIMSDEKKYLEGYFSVSAIDEDLRKIFNNLPHTTKNFKEIKLSTLTVKDGKETPFTSREKFISLGGGYLTSVKAMYSNGFQTSTTYSLVFNGSLIALRSHAIDFSNDRVSKLFDINKVIKIQSEILSPNQDGHYNIELVYDVGDAKFECDSGKAYSAADVHANIIGLATDMECYLKINGIDNSIRKYTYLHDIGLLIYRGIKTPNFTSTYKVTEFEIIN